MAYTPFIREKLARFVVELTSEYNRVYETAGRYPDVPITLFSQAFSEALFENKNVVTASNVRSAIEHSKAVYPDVIKKYLIVFDDKFKDLLDDDRRDHEGLVVKDGNVSGDSAIITKNELSTNNVNNSNSKIINDNSDNNIFKDLRVENNNSNKNDLNMKESSVKEIKDSSSPITDKIDTIAELNSVYDMIINPFGKENN